MSPPVFEFRMIAPLLDPLYAPDLVKIVAAMKDRIVALVALMIVILPVRMDAPTLKRTPSGD